MADDLYDSFSRLYPPCQCSGEEYICKLGGSQCSFMNVFNKTAIIVSKSGPGAFNDRDILEVGKGRQ